MKEKAAIPTFASEDEERAFWSEHDSTEFLDWSKGRDVAFPCLVPSKITLTQNVPKQGDVPSE